MKVCIFQCLFPLRIKHSRYHYNFWKQALAVFSFYNLMLLHNYRLDLLSITVWKLLKQQTKFHGDEIRVCLNGKRNTWTHRVCSASMGTHRWSETPQTHHMYMPLLVCARYYMVALLLTIKHIKREIICQ